MKQNVRLISEMIKNVANDVVPTICIFSMLVSKRHLDPTTSRKSPIVSANHFQTNLTLSRKLNISVHS
jgi:hypothetical protein